MSRAHTAQCLVVATPTRAGSSCGIPAQASPSLVAVKAGPAQYDEPTFHAACFVVTHRLAETIRKRGGTSYIFVTDGIEAALHRAREAAGSQDALVDGDADIARQFLNAGLLDGVRLHLVPVVLGAGTRLFDGVRPDLGLPPA